MSDNLPPPPPSRRVFLAGISGAGKSTAAWRIWLKPAPRHLLIDYTGEWARHAHVTTYTPGATVDAIRRLAPQGRWTIAAALDPDEDLPELVNWLIPLPDLTRSPVRSLGGLSLLLDEVDVAAPPGSLRPHIRTLFRRSRHVGLSLVTATQRPEAVSREVTSQSQDILAMMVVERAAYDYLRAVAQIDPDTLRAWTARHPHGGLYVNRTTGARAGLTDSGQWVRYPMLPDSETAPRHPPVALPGVQDSRAPKASAPSASVPASYPSRDPGGPELEGPDPEPEPEEEP